MQYIPRLHEYKKGKRLPQAAFELNGFMMENSVKAKCGPISYNSITGMC